VRNCGRIAARNGGLARSAAGRPTAVLDGLRAGRASSAIHRGFDPAAATFRAARAFLARELE